MRGTVVSKAIVNDDRECQMSCISIGGSAQQERRSIVSGSCFPRQNGFAPPETRRRCSLASQRMRFRQFPIFRWTTENEIKYTFCEHRPIAAVKSDLFRYRGLNRNAPHQTRVIIIYPSRPCAGFHLCAYSSKPKNMPAWDLSTDSCRIPRDLWHLCAPKHLNFLQGI